MTAQIERYNFHLAIDQRVEIGGHMIKFFNLQSSGPPRNLTTKKMLFLAYKAVDGA